MYISTVPLDEYEKRILKQTLEIEGDLELRDLISYCRSVKISWYPSDEEIVEKLSEILLLIKKYIQADSAEFFFIEKDKIYRIMGVEERKPFKGSACMDIEDQEIIAAYTARQKKAILVKGYIHNRNKSTLFQKGIGRGGKIPDEVLSVPILPADGPCLGVFEFHRTKAQKFTNVQIMITKCLVGWLGRSISRKPADVYSENTALRTWVEDFKNFLDDKMKLEHFISRALRVLQDKTKSEVINFYKIEEEKYQMYGQITHGVFMENHQKFQLEANPFLATVVKKHKAIKVDRKDIDSLQFCCHELFKNDDQASVDNYICVPIGKPSKTLGVVELLNKNENSEFDDNDIQFSLHCGDFCCAAISLHQKTQQKNHMFHMAKSQTTVLIKNMAACPHTFDHFYERLKEVKVPDNFYQFDFYPNPKTLKYLEQYCYFIFQEVFNLQDPCDQDCAKYVDYIITMEKGYRDNPYHNFEHGVNVCHTMFLITRNNKQFFTNLEIQALVVAALGHDVDHPGVTNKWILHSENPLSQCYDDAYLENHHSNLCRLTVQATGIFSHLNAEDFKSTMSFIHKAILQTDRCNGLECRFKINHLVEKNEFTITNKNHRELLIGLMMTSADIGGQAKRFDVNARLCQNLFKEFYAERKKCLTLGYDPPWFSKKTCLKNIPELQIHFNLEICIPCFQILSSVLYGLTPLQRNCSELNDVWTAILKEGVEWGEFEDDYICKSKEPGT